MKRMTLVLALAGAVSSVALPGAASTPEADGRGPYADTDGSVHEPEVAALWAAGITDGCAEWLYCPDEPLTRAEAAAFLTRALDLPPADGVMFQDTAGSLFQRSIGALARADVTRGCADDRFCPEAPLTRGQVASLLVRALGLPEVAGDSFSDDDWDVHEPNIEALAAAGITFGCGEDRFCPTWTVSREEMASFLVRALELEPPPEMPEIPADVREELQEPEWPTGPGAGGWRPLVESYFAPADVDRAIQVIACESNGDPDARNPYSGASGLFQHLPGAWPERAAGAGFPGASVFDPEANVAAAAWLLYESDGGGWHHWVCS